MQISCRYFIDCKIQRQMVAVDSNIVEKRKSLKIHYQTLQEYPTDFLINLVPQIREVELFYTINPSLQQRFPTGSYEHDNDGVEYVDKNILKLESELTIDEYNNIYEIIKKEVDLIKHVIPPHEQIQKILWENYAGYTIGRIKKPYEKHKQKFYRNYVLTIWLDNLFITHKNYYNSHINLFKLPHG